MKKDLPAKGSDGARLILSILVLLAFVPLSLYAIPKVMALGDAQTRAALQQQMQSQGIGGWFVFLGIQVLQVVVAMIPGEPVEIFAGLMYVALWGTLSCMLGIFLGSMIVYLLVRRLGMPIVSIFIDPKKFQNLRFLQDKKRFERISFLLFFIPVPKGFADLGGRLYQHPSAALFCHLYRCASALHPQLHAGRSFADFR